VALTDNECFEYANEFECDESPDQELCPYCDGYGDFMGNLGHREWYLCRFCGMKFDKEVAV